ncbi:hypothetical protein C4559_03820 [Candidatus Microgenomates bacterium]|nr:MAG: hypothetical protein C4559_03820 [Candidatus Microgenomates bacterium]
MAQISKYPILKDVEKRISEIFKNTISNLNSSEDIEDFFKDFLSPVEKIMLAKRLSIAVLLGKGYSYSSISKILRVTSSTISSVNISLKYSGKGYKKMVEKVLKDEKTSEFWQKIDDFLTNNIPMNTGNWSYQRSEYEKEKRKKKKAF